MIWFFGLLPFLAYLGAVASTPYDQLPPMWLAPLALYGADILIWAIFAPLADRLSAQDDEKAKADARSREQALRQKRYAMRQGLEYSDRFGG
jgi:hypothetical protein